VITDSQVFGKVDEILPEDIPLTSFSILMARYKGLLDNAVRGIAAIDKLKDGDTVLIAEGCTHHRQCGDIGSVKIPKWLSDHSGKELVFKTVSGTEFPDDLSPYALIVHCGGCMLNGREVAYRSKCAEDQGVPITNYGTMIAYVHGILERSLEIFPELKL
jgi:[FeFe] hydrogenase H-cluster maturation GTPase HydF